MIVILDVVTFLVKVLLTELVESVGLKDDTLTEICCQLVTETTKVQNVLTSRSTVTMREQYYKVVADLMKYLPTDKFESLTDNLQTKT